MKYLIPVALWLLILGHTAATYGKYSVCSTYFPELPTAACLFTSLPPVVLEASEPPEPEPSDIPQPLPILSTEPTPV